MEAGIPVLEGLNVFRVLSIVIRVDAGYNPILENVYTYQG